MVYIEAGLLTCLFIIGGICSWTDFKTTKIPNRYLLIAFCTGAIFHILLMLVGGLAYYPFWLINMLIADVLAFLMYIAKIWAAGDAKLFMVLYYLTPPVLFEANDLSLGVIPYLYIFLPAFVWIIADSILRFCRREPYLKLPTIHVKQRLLGMFKVMVESTAMYCIVTAVVPELTSNNEMLLAVLMIIYAYFCAGIGFMQKWYVVTGHALVVIAAYITGLWRFSMPDWRSYVLLITSILLQRFTTAYNYQLIPVSNVKKGMIPSAQTVLSFTVSRVHNLPTDASEELSAAITETEVVAIRRWESSANGAHKIWIVRKVAFAFMIFFGFSAWIVVRLVG